jgi:hypothetical protein
MRKLISGLLGVLLGTTSSAQNESPVKWRFTTKKEGVNKYSIHITAFMESSWQMYTQQLNHKDASLVTIEFEPNAFIIYIDKFQEIGNPSDGYDPLLEHEIRSYRVAVNFVQKVQIVVDEPIALKGTIHYVIGDGIDKLENHKKEFKITLNQ